VPILRLFAALCALFAAAPAAAYWDYGHRVVAAVAWESMNPATRSEVGRLLGQARRLETPTCPMNSLEDASVWADCIKPMGDRFSYQNSWHYQNVDICQPFSLTGACKDGNCVSAQIERNARLLADKALPVRERVQALAYLVHFVGDLAQPMHGGDRGDRGGNEVRAAYGLIGGRTNLHSIWDGWLPERAITTPSGAVPPSNDLPLRARARLLMRQLPAAEQAALAGGTVEDWSRESWSNARDLAYASLIGAPCGPLPADRPSLTEEKVQALLAPVRKQVLGGGLRLGRMLDDALLDGKAPERRRD
jgi:hypothetical protein